MCSSDLAKKYWNDDTAVAGQQFEFAFDAIGNRTLARSGGDGTGQGLRESLYSLGGGLLNQYATRTVPSAFDVIGVAPIGTTVQVDNQAANRKGEYYWKTVSADNATRPFLKSVTVTGNVGQNQLSQTVTPFLPKSTSAQPEQLSYDLDGNLLSDGKIGRAHV